MVDLRGYVRFLLAALAMTVLPAPEGKAGSAAGFDFAFQSLEGGPLPLAQWRGRPVLVVNTASRCGFTPQYADLQALWRRYRERGLVVLGVPSNDFGGQEPGSAEEIKEFCEVNFDIDFPMADKQVVSGPEAHPFYQWVVKELGAAHAPRWNFYKYLIAPDGRLAGAWPSNVKPGSPAITEKIEALLRQ
ncbi:MAG: glutathione peroxidase [Thalassobaculales bacterium]